MVHVTSSRGLRQIQVEDEHIDAMECGGSCYPYFTVFTLLVLRGIVVI
jgi:hypothetical protein